MTVELSPAEITVPSSLLSGALQGLHLFYGHPAAREVGFYLTAAWLCRGERAVVVDGENNFDPFVFGDAARRVALSPEQLLQNLFVSRAFTCHQLQALVVDRLAPALRETRSRLVLAVGLLSTFYDEQVPLWEARRLLRPTLGRLRRLARRGCGVLVLLPGEPRAAGKREIFLEWTKACADRIFRVEPGNWEAPSDPGAPGRPYTVQVSLEKPAGGEQIWQIRFDPALAPRRRRQPQ